MTIKTLELIHCLLIGEEARTSKAYNESRRLQHEYEEGEIVDAALAKRRKDAADEDMKNHLVALDALTEFEAREW